MKASEIHVNGLYTAKVSNRLVTVRVDSIDERPGYSNAATSYKIKGRTVYHVTNTLTGRKTTFRSAMKFRGPAGPNEPGKDIV